MSVAKLYKSRGFSTGFERDAYSAGFDCAINGANTTNCNYSHFSSPLHTAAWESGKRDGEKEHAIPKQEKVYE